MIGLYYERIIGNGGAQTLLFRMSQWLRQHEYDVNVLTWAVDASNIVQRISEYTSVVRLSGDPNKTLPEILRRDYAKSEDMLIVFTLDSYIKIVRIINKYELKCHCLLYVIHSDGLKYLYSRNYLKNTLVAPIRYVLSASMSKMIENLINTSSVVFMSDDSWLETYKYYKFRNVIATPKIVCLPIYIKKDAETDYFKRILLKRRAQNKIITVARADFPFKGYVIGLVKDYTSLPNEIKTNVSLTIITTDQKLVKQKIFELLHMTNADIEKHKIEILENINYEDLQSYYNSTLLSVGMGTSVLDAANCSVPTLVVESYTYDLNLLGYFHDIPDTVSMSNDPNCESSASRLSLIEALFQILSLSDEEYLSCCYRTKKALTEYYDIDKNMSAILESAQSAKKCYLSKSQSLFFYGKNFYYRLRKKIINHN